MRQQHGGAQELAPSPYGATERELQARQPRIAVCFAADGRFLHGVDADGVPFVATEKTVRAVVAFVRRPLRFCGWPVAQTPPMLL